MSTVSRQQPTCMNISILYTSLPQKATTSKLMNQPDMALVAWPLRMPRDSSNTWCRPSAARAAAWESPGAAPSPQPNAGLAASRALDLGRRAPGGGLVAGGW